MTWFLQTMVIGLYAAILLALLGFLCWWVWVYSHWQPVLFCTGVVGVVFASGCLVRYIGYLINW